ncbi:ABC transporter permease [Paenibacillus sp. E194]|uniref:ABC transporter permease n=1 Tax=Paenibacillus sp. E194 TaxID=1458845 RepID=UPI000A9B3ED9|nr:ABC transporter permease [Paenibacillus sp. E194]
MRVRDYLHLSWDQLKRRKVVTGLCAAGISIGCAAIIIAMSVGESAQTFAEKQLNTYLKMDEITVTPNTGVNQGGNQGKTADSRQKVRMTRVLSAERLQPRKLRSFATSPMSRQLRHSSNSAIWK